MKNPPTLILAAATAVTVLSLASLAHAGFEWRAPPAAIAPAPAAPAAPSAESAPVTPVTREAPAPLLPSPAAAAADPVNTPSDDGLFLPLPGEMTSAPAPQPVVVRQPPPERVLRRPAGNASAAPAPLALPPRHTPARRLPPPPAVTAPRTAVILPPDAPASVTNVAPTDLLPPQQPVIWEPVVSGPVVSEAGAPVMSRNGLETASGSLPGPVSKTVIVMPQDAPDLAVSKTPNPPRLVINPYPVDEPAKPAPLAAALPGDVVEGFGEGLPLAIALQQVVPPAYAFSFATNVNPGLAVSWEGGKSWTAIVDTMLAPHGLEARVQGNVLMVRQAGDNFSSAAPAVFSAGPIPIAKTSPPENEQPARDPKTAARTETEIKTMNFAKPEEIAAIAVESAPKTGAKTDAAEKPAAQIIASVTEAAPAPARSANDEPILIRRKRISDPGNAETGQPRDTLARIETASGASRTAPTPLLPELPKQ